MYKKRMYQSLTWSQQHLVSYVPRFFNQNKSYNILEPQMPPYKYIEVRFICGLYGCNQRTAGLVLTIENLVDRRIEGLELDFFLWKNNRGYPETGRNHFRRTYHFNIEPESQGIIHCILDDAFHFIPRGPLEFDRLHISRIIFANGSTWSDSLGLHCYPYEPRVEESL